MPSWGALLRELNSLKKDHKPGGEVSPFDVLRRKYLAKAHLHTKRAVILYASKWTQPQQDLSPDVISITDEDVQGFMEVLHGVKERELDLVLHSPGGSIEAAEAIVSYLRSRFDHIRVIVPYAAMSAASMISCASNRIVMGKHSFLGPTDPQLILQTSLGVRFVAAQSVLEQFEKAKQECQNPRLLAAWLPMLNQYGPDLLVRCKKVSELSESLVRRWLERYMFKGKEDAQQKAAMISSWLSEHDQFKSHGRHIPREELDAKGLVVDKLETDQQEQDNFLSVFHSATLTFDGTGCTKIIENHNGSAFIKQTQQLVLVQQPGPATPVPLRGPSGPSSPPFKKKGTNAF